MEGKGNHTPAEFGLNEGYLAELYERYQRDPASVAPQWREFFSRWSPPLAAGPEGPAPAVAVAEARLVAGLLSLVQAIRERGHLAAQLDPLGLRPRTHSHLLPQAHGLSPADLESLPAGLVPSPLARGARNAGQAVERLRAVYCGSSGYEFAHLRDPEERAWLQGAVEEGRFRPRLGPGEKRRLLERLTQVEALEAFLHRYFPGQTWFSIQGTDMLVPMLDELVMQVAHSPIRALVVGMPHRGRLNVLAHVFGKPYEEVLAEFTGGVPSALAGQEWGQGWMLDVKYHLGARSTLSGSLALMLLPNPSHLEMVDPVALGSTRALQEARDHSGPPLWDGDSAMALLLHGDAAFAGQGIVAESLNLQGLEGFRTWGTVHIVINNQLGFTAEPGESHSTPYPTDLARGYDIPVVHVNADDPEACLEAVRLAFAYRQRFHKDIVVDLVGYRRYGHNEGDEPSFTQPLYYRAVREHPTVRELWARRLAGEGLVAPEEAEALLKQALESLRRARESLPSTPAAQPPRFHPDSRRAAGLTTAVPREQLLRLNEELHRLPEGFHLHPKLARPFERRREALRGGGRIDWGHAEALALASLLSQGVPVRLTGQDSERGTFSQRHAVLHDAQTGAEFTPLASLPSARASFAVHNTPLTEEALLAFEYGYSLQAPGALVLWEAQYGDFVNNAMGVVEEFVVSGEAKWGLRSGLVLLLPHGYEGQGPDHSSAHLERFLQLCAEENIRVACPTTAGQYFHLLRRQALLCQQDPHPLVVLTPKSLLRHPLASTTLEELAQGSFRPVLDDPRASGAPERVRRLVLCTGKVYADLASHPAYQGAEGLAVVRVEELYPFPHEELARVLARYRGVREVVWLQEEPRNRGAWGFVAPRLAQLLPKGVPLLYAGRPERASPAEGYTAQHREVQRALLEEALGLTATPTKTARGEV